MPDGPLQFLDSDRLLRFDQITRVVRVLAKAGIRKLRLTGGEPLMRPHVDQLIAQLVQVPGITDLALTTNGMLLADQAEQLHNAGLQRLNISLDTLREESFQRISRRPGSIACCAALIQRCRWALLKCDSMRSPFAT